MPRTLPSSVPPNPALLAGRVALVTGAARGIGQGIALALAEGGADVALIDVANLHLAEDVARQIEGMGRRALVHQTDVSDRAQVEAMVTATVTHFGRLDIVVANAARSVRKPFIELTWDDAWATFSVTLFGVWHTCQFAAQHLVQQGQGGKLIVISSAQAEVPAVLSTAYNASKAAVNQLVATMANELAEDHINVNAIMPGWIDTPGERAFATEEQIQVGGARIPWGRLGQPEDMGRLARFLASDEADYITGSIIRADGGFSLRH